MSDSLTVTKQAVVGSKAGLHARPAAVVVAAAKAKPIKVYFSRDSGKAVLASSILRVLSLHVACGETINISASGEGAEEVVSQMCELVEQELDPDLVEQA